MAPVVRKPTVQRLIAAHEKTQRQSPWLEGTLIAGVLLIGLACAVAASRDQGTVVLTRDVGRGDVLTKGDLVLASLPRMSRTFASTQGLAGKVMTRAVEAGQPLRGEDVITAVAVQPGELEVPLRVFAGTLRPRPGDSVRLAAVSAEGEALVLSARVLAMDVQEDRANLRAAMGVADAVRIATLRSPQIRLLLQPKGRP
ncbi:MAG TPA: SAF domain-containing protein [Thermoanaerobaculia bacterium]